MRTRTAGPLFVTIAAACLAAGTADAHDAPTLLHKHSCYLCHADQETKAGPAFADIASAYGTGAQAVARLVTIIRKGAFGGKTFHMPPHPEVSNNEARAMARYVLSVTYMNPRPVVNTGPNAPVHQQSG